MPQPERDYSIRTKTYMDGNHGNKNSNAHYYDDEEEKKNRVDRKDWYYEAIRRYSKDLTVKCFNYNHNTHSVYLSTKHSHDKYMRNSVKPNTRGKDRHMHHTFIEFI
jgi:hypothetical protein